MMARRCNDRLRVAGRCLLAFWLCAAALAASAAVDETLPPPSRTRIEFAPRPQLALTAVAEEIAVDGVSLFSTGYLAAAGDGARRPVVFFWNGGPGGATNGLHEAFGPRRPRAAPQDPAARSSLDNPDSPIDLADLVFVDAAGTGYGRELEDGAFARHWGVAQDARSAAGFVRAWLARHGRERDPVFLVGQSYAGIRVPLAAQALLEAMPALDLRGLLLVSPSTGGPRGAQVPEQAADARKWLACAADLAVYAQTAAYHGLGALAGRPAHAVAGEIEGFLAQRQAVAPADYPTIAGYTGLPLEMVAGEGGCVARSHFLRGLLARRGERAGTADTRRHAPLAITETRDPPYDDPSTSPYTLDYDASAAWEHYLRNELGYRPRSQYVRLSLAANKAWDWTWPDTAGASTASVLDGLMAQRPELRVLVAVGYYDLSVPYLQPATVFTRAGLDARANFRIAHYLAGHAVHSDADELARSMADVRDLLRGTP